MLLQNGIYHNVDYDHTTGRLKRFATNNQSQKIRCEAETQSKQKTFYENDMNSKSSCRAQQRLVNLTTNSKNKDLKPKVLNDFLIKKNSVDPEPPFISKVKNYKNSNASTTKDRLSNAIFLNNGVYEYYPKDPGTDRDFYFKNKNLKESKKLDEKCTKDKVSNASQTFDIDQHLITAYNTMETKPENYLNDKKFENVLLGTNEEIKSFDSSKNDYSHVIFDNSTSEKSEMPESSLKKCFEEWFDKKESAVSKLPTEFKQIKPKNRPLKISEVLELHERENKLNIACKKDNSCNINNASKDRLFCSSNKNDVPNYENLIISDLHENFLVDKLENPTKICIEDESYSNNQEPIEDVSTDDGISKFPYNKVSTELSNLSKYRLSRADNASSRSRNVYIDKQEFSDSNKNLKTDDIQKITFSNPRDRAYNSSKSRSPSSSDYSSERSKNRFSISPNNYSMQKINYPKAISTSFSENFSKDFSKDSSKFKESFTSEKACAGTRNFKDFKKFTVRNYPGESSVQTKDKQFPKKNENNCSRSVLISKSYNGDDNKRFSTSGLSTKDHSQMKNLPNSKAIPSKSNANDVIRNFESWTGFQQKRQQKLSNNVHGSSALTPVRSARIESFRPSHPPSKNLLKEYDTSRQQRLKYAKSFSDFNELFKSSYDSARTSSCLAQQRLLCCKPLNISPM